MKNTRRHSCPLRPFVPTFAIRAHDIGWATLGHQYKHTELMLTIANKMLAAHKLLSYSIDLAANSAIGCGSPTISRRTAPRKRFFCAHFMVGCAWEAFEPAGFLDAGLPHPRTARHQSCGSDTASPSQQSRVPTMKKLSLPIAAKIKRGRIAAHKAMAYAALHADSSLSTRLNRYNNHMDKARAIAGGAL